MNIHIRKLTVELLDDWLNYFDNDAFSDNDKWCGCYCMCYHWNKSLQKKRPWNCDKSCAEFNRQQAIDFITDGRMQGYLAYIDDRVVGWCNSNNKTAYDNVNFNFAEDVPDNGEKIKSIVCFSVMREYRGNGIATALLEYICQDAKADGYALIEAYPFKNNKYHAYHGPLSLYVKNGFEIHSQIEECTVCRKIL